MWVAYVDESYSDDFHWVIALLIKHTMINEGHRAKRDVMLRIEDALPTIDADDVELHGYDIFHGLGAFQALELLLYLPLTTKSFCEGSTSKA